MYKNLEFIIRKKWNEQVTYKLLEDILLRDNMLLAYGRVVTNKGTMLFYISSTFVKSLFSFFNRVTNIASSLE